MFKDESNVLLVFLKPDSCQKYLFMKQFIDKPEDSSCGRYVADKLRFLRLPSFQDIIRHICSSMNRESLQKLDYTIFNEGNAFATAVYWTSLWRGTPQCKNYLSNMQSLSSCSMQCILLT